MWRSGEVLSIEGPVFDLGPGTYFAISAKDDSMAGVGIRRNSLVVFSPELEVEDGDVAVVSIEGKLYPRTVYYCEDCAILYAMDFVHDRSYLMKSYPESF